MLNINRERLYDKIRALLDKTMANGCTEAEALSALTKARAMMDAYEVTDEDLRLTKEQAAILKDTETKDDKHGIARFLVKAVSIYCDCDGWRRGDRFVFCGSPSDVQLAEWMHRHLITFVQGELANYLAACDVPRGMRRRMINGFVLGCTGRIMTRVQELVDKSKHGAKLNSKALVLVKRNAIDNLKMAQGIMLRTRTATRKFNEDSLVAGRDAGDRASLHRPVNTARGTFLLK